MPTEAKARKIDDLAQKLRESKGIVLLDYRGLNVSAITALRRDLDKEQVEFHVTKNTLLRIAAKRAEVDMAEDLTVGPTAIAFGLHDEISPARLLVAYARRSRIVSIKGGLIAGRSLTADEIGRVAELPGREQLLAIVVGGLQAPLAQTLAVLQAPLRKIAGLSQALLEKKQSQTETPDA
jgi:large subunit ribosomal protein L10